MLQLFVHIPGSSAAPEYSPASKPANLLILVFVFLAIENFSNEKVPVSLKSLLNEKKSFLNGGIISSLKKPHQTKSEGILHKGLYYKYQRIEKRNYKFCRKNVSGYEPPFSEVRCRHVLWHNGISFIFGHL